MNLYLDHAAATPLSDPMKAYLNSLLDLYGNPSSLHSVGKPVRQILSEARQSVADFIHANPDDITFTPSGSAANTLAVKGLTSENPQINPYEVFCSPTAHKSMQKACESCRCHTPLQVSPVGRIDPCYLDNILTQHNR
ncbi:MAG: aminotransferase class V-fold PLP-dependent enzyme, partial [Lachnospiraceae bacterium]|nr:aminotransferase class V-fold PLP-dependent enzyme [Lachnospiraceae bacterium]